MCCKGLGSKGSLLSIFRKLNKQRWENLMKEGKSFEISQHQVLEAYKCVKADRGADGIDGIHTTDD
jgi:hypothetical protein